MTCIHCNTECHLNAQVKNALLQSYVICTHLTQLDQALQCLLDFKSLWRTAMTNRLFCCSHQHLEWGMGGSEERSNVLDCTAVQPKSRWLQSSSFGHHCSQYVAFHAPSTQQKIDQEGIIQMCDSIQLWSGEDFRGTHSTQHNRLLKKH